MATCSFCWQPATVIIRPRHRNLIKALEYSIKSPDPSSIQGWKWKIISSRTFDFRKAKTRIKLCRQCYENLSEYFQVCEECGRVMFTFEAFYNNRVEEYLCECCEAKWEWEQVKKLIELNGYPKKGLKKYYITVRDS